MLPKSLTPPGYHKAEDHANFGNLLSELFQGPCPAEKKPCYKHKHSFGLSFKLWSEAPVRTGPHAEGAAVYPVTELHRLPWKPHCKGYCSKYGYGPLIAPQEHHCYSCDCPSLKASVSELVPRANQNKTVQLRKLQAQPSLRNASKKTMHHLIILLKRLESKLICQSL